MFGRYLFPVVCNGDLLRRGAIELNGHLVVDSDEDVHTAFVLVGIVVALHVDSEGSVLNYQVG